MKRILLAALAAIAIYATASNDPLFTGPSAIAADINAANSTIANAYARRARKIQVEGRGTVAKILPDDNDGSRHQRFIVNLNPGPSILIAHNIDLAPRVTSLRVGDVISFSGEYEWNPKGGVVHWTHRDPGGRHPAGWIKHDGQSFQ